MSWLSEFLKPVDWSRRGIVVPKDEVESAIRRHFGNTSIRNLSIWEDRGPYRALSRADFETVIFKARTIDPAYATDKFDCDDYTERFLSEIRTWWALYGAKEPLAIGHFTFMREGAENAHEIAWHLDDLGKLRLYEPQGDPPNQECSPEIKTIYEIW